MLKKLICSDVGQNKLMSAATIFFMTISAALLILTALLLTNLLEAIDDLMDRSSGLIFCWVWTGICRRFCREEVYVPVCYRAKYDLKTGDEMTIGKQQRELYGTAEQGGPAAASCVLMCGRRTISTV